MKIGIDGLPLGVTKTGVGHYTAEIAYGVAAQNPGDDFQLLSHLPFPLNIESTAPGNLSLIHAPTNALTRHWWTIGLRQYIHRNGIELFHGTNYDIPVWGGIPTVLTIHDLSLLLFPETHEVRRVRRARRRLPLMARRATRIIVPTESVRGEVSEHLSVKPEKVVAIPEAPRRCFKPIGRAETINTLSRLGIEESFILYVGAIEPRKNLLTLMKAFEEIYKTSSLRPQLVIAGPNGWLSEELFQYVEQSTIKERILFAGYLHDEDLRALYNACAVMSFPALYEGAGLPPLEAMACGAPVITSDARAVVEMVADGAITVPAKDHLELAKQIVNVMTNADLRKNLTERGLRRSAQFSWERAAAATYETYTDALKR